MPERTVTCLGYRYTDAEGYVKLAQRGETVDFTQEEADRGERLGAFATGSETSTVVAEAPVLGLESTDAELVTFAKAATVTQVLEAADGDPALAQRLLDAEKAATGNEPRKTVVKGLDAVISSEPAGTATYVGPDWDTAALTAELDRREIEHSESATDAELSALLVAYDKEHPAA